MSTEKKGKEHSEDGGGPEAADDKAKEGKGPGPSLSEGSRSSNEEVERLITERDDLEDRLAYMQAEFENLKRRCQRDVETRTLRAKECLFEDLLPVLDNLERALGQTATADLETFSKGVRMIAQQLDLVLAQHGLAPIDAKEKEFDPYRHEAVEKVEDAERPDGLIIEEVQRGYTLDGKIIRPSKVRVNALPVKEGKAENKGKKKGKVD